MIPDECIVCAEAAAVILERYTFEDNVLSCSKERAERVDLLPHKEHLECLPYPHVAECRLIYGSQRSNHRLQISRLEPLRMSFTPIIKCIGLLVEEFQKLAWDSCGKY